MSHDRPTTRVYVGNLGDNGLKPEIEKEFERFGDVHDVWVARNPPGFAFVEFLDPRDADDAIRALDGKVICGAKVRVELATGRSGRRRDGRRPPGRRGGRFDGRDDRFGGYRGPRQRDRFADDRDYHRRGSPPRRYFLFSVKMGHWLFKY